MSKQTPNPNEVMDVDAILAKFEDYCDCDEYHIHSPDPEYHIEANADPNDGHMEFDMDAAKAAINGYVAQQNAALLRELLDSKQRLVADLDDTPYTFKVAPTWEIIPASILEAKLKELESV